MQQFHSWAYMWKIPKPLIWKDTCTPIFLAALFTLAKIRKQPKCPPTGEWKKKMWYTYIQWNIIQPWKRKKFCHLQQCVSCVQLFCNPIDCSLPGSSVHGISQATILEWIAFSFSRGSSWARDWTCTSCIGRWTLHHWTTREALKREKFMHLFL